MAGAGRFLRDMANGFCKALHWPLRSACDNDGRLSWDKRLPGSGLSASEVGEWWGLFAGCQ